MHKNTYFFIWAYCSNISKDSSMHVQTNVSFAINPYREPINSCTYTPTHFFYKALKNLFAKAMYIAYVPFIKGTRKVPLTAYGIM